MKRNYNGLQASGLPQDGPGMSASETMASSTCPQVAEGALPSVDKKETPLGVRMSACLQDENSEQMQL